MELHVVTCLDTKHIAWHMVPSFLYDHAKSALHGTPLHSNPSWGTINATEKYEIQAQKKKKKKKKKWKKAYTKLGLQWK